MGIHKDYENMAKTIQEFAVKQQQPDADPSGKQEISDKAQQLEKVCLQARTELEEEYDSIKNSKK
jgi:hypothetical protein